MKLSITHQGILLALIPLAFQFAFLAILVNVLHDNDKEIEKQARFRSLIEHINQLQITASKYASASSAYSLYKRQDLKKQKDEAANKLNQELAEMERFSNGEPELTNSLREVERSTQQILNDVQNSSGNKDSKQPAKNVGDSILSFSQRLTTGIFSPLHEYSERIARLNKERSRFQRVSENRLNLVLIVGTASNIFISLAIALLFTRRITSRLSILSDNASRIASQLPLHVPVSGSDEIAVLDQVFHHMSRDLQTADYQKKSLLGFMRGKLQAPLQKTLEYLRDAQEEEKDNTQLQNRLNPLRGNVLRLFALMQQLLDIENIDAGKLELVITNCSLQEIIDNAVSAMQGYLISKSIKIDIYGSSVKLEADALKLEQVLINLISNAIKYSPNGASIEIKVQTAGFDAIEIAIIDQGEGISPEKLNILFERFRQANPELDTEIGGSGLGLSICKKIIEAHGGAIGASNETDGGSRFWFRLPLKPKKGNLVNA